MCSYPLCATRCAIHCVLCWEHERFLACQIARSGQEKRIPECSHVWIMSSSWRRWHGTRDMKIRVVWRNVIHYVRTDLKEIAFPSSLPDPPSSKPKPRKLKLREHFVVLRTATRLYVQSWRTGTVDFEDDEKDEKNEPKHSSQPKKKNPEDPSIVEELALAARAGSESLRPALQRVYMTRASAYRDALQNFVRGYQEGIGEVLGGHSQSTKHHVERRAAASSPEDEKPNVASPVMDGQPAEKIQQNKGVEM